MYQVVGGGTLKICEEANIAKRGSDTQIAKKSRCDYCA